MKDGKGVDAFIDLTKTTNWESKVIIAEEIEQFKGPF